MEKFRDVLIKFGYIKRRDLENNVEVWYCEKYHYHYIFIKSWKNNKISCISVSFTEGDDLDSAIAWTSEYIKLIDSLSNKYNLIDFEFMLPYLD